MYVKTLQFSLDFLEVWLQGFLFLGATFILIEFG